MTAPTTADNVQQVSTSTGTGNFTLSSLNGRRSFASALGTGSTHDVFYYFIASATAAEWEIGTGHMSDATTLVRDTVTRSSNDRALVNFSAGLKYVASDLPASVQIASVRKAATSPFDYGAIADGSSHPLNTAYTTLSDAQAVYPFATSLSQEIDYCACKAASNEAFGADGAEHGNANPRLNKRLHIPAGIYVFGNDTWLIRKLDSGVIFGDGRLSTVLTSNNTAMAFDGCWYSEFSNFSTQCGSAGISSFKLDGNLPGHPYATFGVQSCTFRDMFFNGNGATYAFTNQLESFGAGQGSEINWWNCFFFNATEACLFNQGFNACDNAIYGGDCQVYSKNGIESANSPISIFGMSFQSTTGYQQIVNGGFDIYMGDSGVGDAAIVTGCRTESMRFLHSGGSGRCHVSAVSSPGPTVLLWAANTTYPLDSTITVPIGPNFGGDDNDIGQLFKATTGGVSGATHPVWPIDAKRLRSSNTNDLVTDNTVVWQEVPFYFIDIANGSLDTKSVTTTVGRIKCPSILGTRIAAVTADRVMGRETEIYVDATNNDVLISMPYAYSLGEMFEKQIVVKRTDASAHSVTVSALSVGVGDGGGQSETISARGFRIYKAIPPAGSGNPSWLPVSSDQAATTAATQTDGDNSTKIATTAYLDRLRGAAGGIATLDSGGKVPTSQLALTTANIGGYGNIVSVAKSADYTTVLGDLNKCIDNTTGSSADVTTTLLSAATAGAGAVQHVAKVDSGSKKAIVQMAEVVTVTIASPGVVTFPGPIANDTPVVLSTTGALATGLTAGSTYYTINGSGSTAQLSATSGGSAINTSGSQSGVHTAKIALAWLSAQKDRVTLRSDGALWQPFSWSIKPRIDLYSAAGSFTWNRPPLARTITPVVVGGGNSGASGARRASGTASSGGGIAAGTGISYLLDIPASNYNATEAVVVGAGATGAPAVTTDDTDGNPGAFGGISSFKNLANGTPGTAPSGGKASANNVAGSAGIGRIAGNTGGVGGAGNPGNASSGTNALAGIYAGGGGSGQATSPVSQNGGPSSFSFGGMLGDTQGAGGIGSSKTAPTTGSGIMFDTGLQLGGSGGGGWVNADGTAGDGANGSAPGGSGGSGGSSVNGHNSGKGGDGAAGAVQATTKF